MSALVSIAATGIAEGQTFISVSDDLGKLDSWTQSGANLWQEKSGNGLPDGITYFCDISEDNGTDRIDHSISNLYPETGTIRWRFSVVCTYSNSSVNNFTPCSGCPCGRCWPERGGGPFP